MPKFYFDVVETSLGTLVIEADNYDQALEEIEEIKEYGVVTDVWDSFEQNIEFRKSEL